MAAYACRHDLFHLRRVPTAVEHADRKGPAVRSDGVELRPELRLLPGALFRLTSEIEGVLYWILGVCHGQIGWARLRLEGQYALDVTSHHVLATEWRRMGVA